jgi:Glycosyl hydrolases family 31
MVLHRPVASRPDAPIRARRIQDALFPPFPQKAGVMLRIPSLHALSRLSVSGLFCVAACSSGAASQDNHGLPGAAGTGNAGATGVAGYASGADAGAGGVGTGGVGTGGVGTGVAGGGANAGGANAGGANAGGTPSSAGSDSTSGGVSSGGAGAPPPGGAAGTASVEPPPGTTPPITPRWAFEPWAWEDNTNTRASAEALIKGYTDRTIPVGAVIIDSPWETAYNTLLWDTTRYPTPTAMISGFHAQGVKVLLWITAFVDTDASDYASVKQQKFGVNNSADATWWKGTGIHVDITNPAAAAWWNAQLGARLADGIDGWKLDRGADYLGDPVKTTAGSLAITDFKKQLSADFFDYTTTTNPNAIVCVRPFDAEQGGVGSDLSKNSVGWVGDHDGGFAGIATEKDDIYTSAQMGYGAPGVEVGGYMGNAPSKDSLIRYAEFGALTPLMENGGANGGLTEHLPWYWDTATVDTYRYFASLHSELAAYNFSYGVDAHLTGKSIIRSADKTLNQHLLGDQLFTSVITTDVTTKAVTFPTGSSWVDYWDEDTVYMGGSTVQYAAPLTQYPLFIRVGAIVPLDVKTAVTGHGDTTSAGKTTLLVYPEGKSTFTFHRAVDEGTSYTDVVIDVDAASGAIAVTGSAAASYRLRVKSFQAPTSVAGADTWSYDATNKVIVVDKQGATFALTIAGLKGYP